MRVAVSGALRAYGAILFADRAWVGALYLLATFWFPNAGLAGLLAAAAGMLTARLLAFSGLESGLHVYNSLLVGLSMGAYYQLNSHLVLLVILGAVLAVFATVALRDVLWRLGNLPPLSLPFVLVALTATLAAHSYGTLLRYLPPLAPHGVFVHPWIDQFLTALGAAFFTPHPAPGLLMFVGLLLTSRWLALLAVAGFACGFAAYAWLSGSPHPDLVAWNGFNFILVAMALGGIFLLPGAASFALAMTGAVIAALITAASETFMLVYGLPVMALPFLATTLVILLALTQRSPTRSLQLMLARPGLPEAMREAARLAEARGGEFGSVPLLPPFHGEWMVYQGFDGEHTHRPPWQHALDFHIVEDGQSYRADGARLEEYYCFGLPVLAPAAGVVAACLDALPDNRPGDVDMVNNWGNHVLIRMDNGLFVLLAHLRQGSIEVKPGEYVRAGQQVASCGSSGRSPQPHLHLHLQAGSALGAPTRPFHLTSVLHRRSRSEKACFRLFARPGEGEMVVRPVSDRVLAESLGLYVGRMMRYRVRGETGAEREGRLDLRLNPDGELRLWTDRGANAALILREDLLACHDRRGPCDELLDAWLLTLGLTPLCEGEAEWSDAPSMCLLPMTRFRRWLAACRYPMGAGVNSRYRRVWNEDHWRQEGRHRLGLPGGDVRIRTEAIIRPDVGCETLLLESGAGGAWVARLIEIGQRGDAGIPAWRREFSDSVTISGKEVLP